jgi:hypothetical protein
MQGSAVAEMGAKDRRARSEEGFVSKRWVYFTLGCLVLYVVVRSIVAAAIKPFWFDELLTLAVSSQPNAKDMWRALSQGVDSQAPLFHLLERVALGAVSNPHIAMRLVPLLGFCAALVCVFVYLRKRNSDEVALLSTTILLLTIYYSRYATEARAYSAVVGCITVAMVCYQRVPSLKWTALLGVSLAVAESFHYYAIFCMVPFGLAEVAYWWRARRLRWPVWCALLVGVTPLVAYWPVVARMKAEFGAHIWTHYGLANVPATYGWLFFGGTALGVAVVEVCVAGVVAARLRPAWLRGSVGAPAGENDEVEAVLLLGLLGVPLITLAVTDVMHGAMTDRYLLVTAIGVVLSLACIFSIARKEVLGVAALCVLSTIGVRELSFWRSVHSLQVWNSSAPVEDFVGKVGHEDLPVVIDSGTRALQLEHYASQGWKSRFIFLQDEEKSLQYLGTDSLDRNLVLLKPYAEFQMESFAEFVARHRQFLLYVEDEDKFNWLPSYLPGAGFEMQVLRADPLRKVYLVRTPDRAK